MGQHKPPGWGHRRRFLVAFAGILALAFATMALVAFLFPDAG
jgi:hypothetical protein